MRKTFNDLTTSDRKLIHTLYNDTNITQEAVQHQLSNKYEVTERTIRSWAHKLGLGLMSSSVNPLSKSPAKILVFDIETSLMSGYFFRQWKANITANALINDWFMLTWSAKWLFDEKVMSDRLTGEEALQKDDKRIAMSLHKLIDEADIVIAHNGKKFDIKKINTRFLLHRLPKPSPYKLIDTCLHARKSCGFSYNTLDYLGEVFGVGRKIKHSGLDLWIGAASGDDKALIEMEEYNKGDVTLLEDVYLAMRSYIDPHPNMGLYITDDSEVCPTCASDDLSHGGIYYTNVNAYQTFSCNACGSQGRSRKAIKNKKQSLLAPMP